MEETARRRLGCSQCLQCSTIIVPFCRVEWRVNTCTHAERDRRRRRLTTVDSRHGPDCSNTRNACGCLLTYCANPELPSLVALAPARARCASDRQTTGAASYGSETGQGRGTESRSDMLYICQNKPANNTKRFDDLVGYDLCLTCLLAREASHTECPEFEPQSNQRASLFASSTTPM
jgi:hypothetical protein